jgi:hypothetical protein
VPMPMAMQAGYEPAVQAMAAALGEEAFAAAWAEGQILTQNMFVLCSAGRTTPEHEPGCGSRFATETCRRVSKEHLCSYSWAAIDSPTMTPRNNVCMIMAPLPRSDDSRC